MVQRAECLCGAIAFEVSGPTTDVYQCHCSYCRTVSGSACISTVLVSANDFEWKKGQDKVRSFRKSETYLATFCSDCGSPMPFSNPEGNAYWIPAGILPLDETTKVATHVFVGSKASWDVIGDDGEQFEKGYPV